MAVFEQRPYYTNDTYNNTGSLGKFIEKESKCLLITFWFLCTFFTNSYESVIDVCMIFFAVFNVHGLTET